MSEASPTLWTASMRTSWYRWMATSCTNPRTARLLPGGSGADVAIGSRYVAGGAADETWGFRRRHLSLWGNRLARWIAGIKGVHECTAICTAAPREVRVAEDSVLGFAFLVALLHRLLHSDARVVEEPIYFSDCERGVTKLGLDSMVVFT